ncbi:MAG: hypothetical protein L3J45_01995 [Flavobacteriaceae bacterium]|nr:hypothetical protein [Flavobacteriaceae bacterium]
MRALAGKIFTIPSGTSEVAKTSAKVIAHNGLDSYTIRWREHPCSCIKYYSSLYPKINNQQSKIP